MMRFGQIHARRAVIGAAMTLAMAVCAMPAQAADPIYPIGSRIGLVPPAGMVPSPNFEGFENIDKSAAILLATFPAEAFAQLDKTMYPQALQKQGIDIDKREPMQVKAGKGFLLSGTQESPRGRIRKWLLVAAAGDVTALVTVQVPEQNNTYTDAAVRDALATLSVRDTVPDAERLSLLPFTVGNLAGFQIDDVLPGRALMLIDKTPVKNPAAEGSPGNGADAPDRNVNARFLIASLEGGPTEWADRDTFARTTFDQIGGIRNVQVQDAEPLRIDGQAGYETLANAKEAQGDGDLKVVQWLQFGSGGYMQMVGVARAEVWLDVFKRLRTVRDSVAPK